MPLTATINSKTKDGAAIELTVEKSGANSAKLTAKNWTLNKPPPSAASKVSDTKLHSATVTADLSTVTCRAEIFGPDPKVVLALNALAAQKTVTVEISETLGGMGDSKETYVLADADYEKIKTFITDAQFPTA